MSKEKKYYSTENIDKTGAQYRILLGMRANGKSFAVKKKVIEAAYRGEQFVYMRRYERDTKTTYVQAYFADVIKDDKGTEWVKKWTHNRWQGIYVFRGIIYFCTYDDETLKPIAGDEIGRVVDLQGIEHYKSQSFPQVTNVIFEEFITNRLYLRDEPSILQQMISTIARDRDITVWMIGNTISRVCPYYTEWGLQGIPKQDQGTIDVYTFKQTNPVDGTERETKIAVENCEAIATKTTMFFGKSAEQITGGVWETKEMPHLPGPKENYYMLYELLMEDLGFSFVVQLMVNSDGGMFVYVYPFTGKRHIKRKITTKFSDDPLTTTKFNDKINAEVLMKQLLGSGKVCFSDNLTGMDFEHVLANRKGTL